VNRKIIPYSPKLKQLARQLRNNSTESEICLWQKLKRKQVCGYGFRRQKPIDNYILTFFCHELMLGIEIDSYSHVYLHIHEKDTGKIKKMNEIGISVLRFSNHQVLKDMENVIRKIEYFIKAFEKNNLHTSV